MPPRVHRLLPILATFLALACAASWGQVARLETRVKHRPTLVDADLELVARQVGELTSRTIELEPGVCALVTASWDEPLTSEEFYQAFLDIVRALGYVVVEEGLLTKLQLPADTPRDPAPACRRYPLPH